MKKIYLVVLVLLAAVTSKAQAPQKFSYQAVIRNNSNVLISNQAVSERISLVKDSATGTVVYSETQNVKTNANGLVSLQVGTGSVVSGSFSSINWGASNYFIKIETDPNGGSNYTINTTTQLLSVPYALYAANGGTAGPQGIQGPKGDSGARGLQGIQGVQGLKGDQGIQGIQGIQGLTGATGAKGDSGARGLQGIQGIQGLKGDQGIQGIQGLTGATGAKGDSGARGLQGIQGIQGVKGDQGIQGVQGLTGATGAKGDSGARGLQGFQGIQGLKGDQGLQGIQGLTGATGAKGDSGARGLQGIQGIQGLKGDKGDQGIQGIQGLTGATGAKGDSGARGLQGIQGIQGLKGDQGIQGIQGLTGATGAKGDSGARGLQGIQGIQGLKGEQGIQGIQGLTGATGSKGDSGARGLQGIQGIQGLKGDKGDQGIQGIQGLAGATGAKGDSGARGLQGIQGVQGLKGATGAKGDSGVSVRSTVVVGDSLFVTLSTGQKVNAGNVRGLKGAGFQNGTALGQILYWNGNIWDTIKVGKKGQFLQLNSSNLPQWAGLTYPTIKTLPATSISYKNAVLKGVIVDGGGIGIDSVSTSFLISTASNTPISSCKQIRSFQRNADTFYVDLLGAGDSLLPNTTYYVRASGFNNQYNDASGGNTIGNEISFTTGINNTVVITTISYDTIQSPLVVGGKVAGNSTSIIERGILYGLADTLNIYNSTLAGMIQYQTSFGYGGFGTPSLRNGKITAGNGLGDYVTKVEFLINGKTYYVKAYAIDAAGKIYYGKTLTISPKAYTRKTGVGADFANVYWTTNYTLFDLQTDEVILPNINGNYTFWYTSNQNPVAQQNTLSASSLPGFLFYKFKTQANCQRWCDIHNGIIKP